MVRTSLRARPESFPPGAAGAPHPGEAGQASLVAAALLAVALAVAWGLARLGAVVVADAAAQAVADATALAGALEGRPGAAAVAEANAATLVEWRERDRLVQVVVERAGHRARATAEWSDDPLP